MSDSNDTTPMTCDRCQRLRSGLGSLTYVAFDYVAFRLCQDCSDEAFELMKDFVKAKPLPDIVDIGIRFTAD